MRVTAGTPFSAFQRWCSVRQNSAYCGSHVQFGLISSPPDLAPIGGASQPGATVPRYRIVTHGRGASVFTTATAPPTQSHRCSALQEGKDPFVLIESLRFPLRRRRRSPQTFVVPRRVSELMDSFRSLGLSPARLVTATPVSEHHQLVTSDKRATVARARTPDPAPCHTHLCDQ